MACRTMESESVQWEATGSVHLSHKLNNITISDELHDSALRWAAAHPCFAASTPPNTATTLFGWSYYPYYHVAATAWNGWMFEGINPYIR